MPRTAPGTHSGRSDQPDRDGTAGGDTCYRGSQLLGSIDENAVNGDVALSQASSSRSQRSPAQRSASMMEEPPWCSRRCSEVISRWSGTTTSRHPAAQPSQTPAAAAAPTGRLRSWPPPPMMSALDRCERAVARPPQPMRGAGRLAAHSYSRGPRLLATTKRRRQQAGTSRRSPSLGLRSPSSHGLFRPGPCVGPRPWFSLRPVLAGTGVNERLEEGRSSGQDSRMGSFPQLNSSPAERSRT
jgi:hypothetical protein